MGSHTYAMVCTKSDISYVVKAMSIFLSNPRKKH